jgi:hypothetical protein
MRGESLDHLSGAAPRESEDVFRFFLAFGPGESDPVRSMDP